MGCSGCLNVPFGRNSQEKDQGLRNFSLLEKGRGRHVNTAAPITGASQELAPSSNSMCTKGDRSGQVYRFRNSPDS